MLREVTEAVRRRLTVFAVGHFAGDEAVLVVDETGEERSSTDAVGAAREYSGALTQRWRQLAAAPCQRGPTRSGEAAACEGGSWVRYASCSSTTAELKGSVPGLFGSPNAGLLPRASSRPPCSSRRDGAPMYSFST